MNPIIPAARSWAFFLVICALAWGAGQAAAAPVISAISNQTVNEDNATAAIPFTITGFTSRTPAVTGSSSNPQLVADSGIAIAGAGGSRTVTVTPLPNQNGTARITITVTDPAGTDTETFTLTVNPVNDPPTVTDVGNQTINEDQTLGPVSFTVNDVDTPVTQLVITTSTSNGTLVPASAITVGGSGSDRTLTVSPAANQSGSSTIGIFVSDGSLSATTRFTLSVTPVNDPPTISDVPDQTINENGQAGPISFGVNDVDSGAANLVVTGSSSNPTLVPDGNIVIGSAAATGAGRTVTVTPARGQSGTALITLTVSDGAATASDTFTVTVIAANRPPSISSIPTQTTAEDTTLGPISFTISDAETSADNLVITRTSSNQTLVPDTNISVGGSGGNRTLTITPAAHASGDTLITLTVSDGSLSAGTEFNLTVTSVNDPPTISDIGDQSINENGQAGPIPFTVGDLETSAATLVVTATSSNPNLVPNGNIVIDSTSTSGAGRMVTVTPVRNQSGVALITLTVSDGAATASDSFTLTVLAVNRPPSISDVPDQTTAEDTALGPLSFTISDPETGADSLTVTRSSSNQTLVPDSNISMGGSGGSRTVTITPAANAFGSALITLTVSDGRLSASDQFTVTVTSVNDPPAISDVPDQSVSENGQVGPVLFTVGDVETSAAELLVTATSSNPNLIPNGNILIASAPTGGPGRTVVLTPLQNQSGSALITLTVSDGAATASDSFTVTVSSVNDPPAISNVPDQTTAEDTVLGPISFTVNDSEVSAENLTVTRSSSNPALLPEAGMILGGSGANRTLTLAPAANAFGSALVTLTVSDGSLTASDQFTVTVTSVNDPPAISEVADQSVSENGQVGPVPFTVSDVETSAADLVVTANSSNPNLIPNGNIVIAPSAAGAGRAITLTPVRGQSGVALITLTVSDGAATAADTFTVTVSAGNKPPTISDLPDVGVPAGSSTGNIAFKVDDPDTNPASLILTAVSSNPELVPPGGIVLGGSGNERTVAITPAPNQTGSVIITVIVSDGSLTASDTFVVRVTEVQQFDFGDAPESTLAVLYRTRLASGGPRHRIVPGFFLGRTVDAEPDGQPSPDGLGDDKNPASSDDEDGVQFTSPFAPGKMATLIVTASAQGILDAWFDFNRVGGFDPADHLINKVALVPGPNSLTVSVPPNAPDGDTFARFRFSRTGLESPNDAGSTAPLVDGEVEDYRVSVVVEIEEFDFGDAPDVAAGTAAGVGYPTLLVNNGPRHRLGSGFFLGALVDPEQDGQPNATATGDDSNPPRADDEDGVQFLGPLVPGQSAQLLVTASLPGRLDAWVDFNQNRSWADPGDQIFVSIALSAGPNSLSFAVPPSAAPGRTFARFRFSRDGKLNFVGPAPDGEVEDYQVPVESRGPCDVSSKGSDFWLTFPGNYPPSATAPLSLTLCLVGGQGTTGLVEIAGLRYTRAFSIPAAMSTLVTLPDAASLGDVIDVVQSKGIHVTANAPIAVYGLNRIPFSADGFLGLPTGALGTDYLVLGYLNVFNNVSALNGTQFGLVATEDDTLVTIIPSRTVLGHPEGEPFILELKKGQTYQLRDPEDATADLSGTEIIASKPIAVFGSHQCANINSPSRLFCDYLVEQLLPTAAWGKFFHTVPLATRVGGDTFRVIAAKNNTTLYVNGVENATLDRGQIRTLTLSAAARINSDKPVYIAQFANSSDFDQVKNADPFMVAVPPTRWYAQEHMICTGPSAFSSHFVNIVAPASVVGALTLDGNVVNAASFSPIGASGFSFARLPVAQGTHTLSAAQPFATTVYGFSLYESYAWPGGLHFGDITPPTITCPDDFTVALGGVATTTGASSCQAIVPDLRDKVQVSDNCQVPSQRAVTQSPPPGTLVGVGTHEIVLTAQDAAGNEASCTVLMTVVDPGPPNIICPKDFSVPCTKGSGANVVFQVTARTPCGTTMPVDCVPPSGSFFPAGTTTVTCTVKGFPNQTCSFKVTVQCTPGTIGNIIRTRTLSLSWDDDAALETATTLDGPWTPVPAAVPPFSPAPAGTQQFFRLRKSGSSQIDKAEQKPPVLIID